MPLEVYNKYQPILASRTHISNKLPLDLKPIGYKSKFHLLKVGFDLLLSQQFYKWIHRLIYRVNSLDLNVTLLEVITDEVVSPLDVLRFLVRPQLLSKGYGPLLS